MPIRPGSCYVIAEAGSCHMGNESVARELVEQAARVGADACKFQLFRLEDILVGPPGTDRRTELPVEWLPKLAGLCREYHIDFLCTPFAAWSVDALAPHVWAYKIGSFEWKRNDIWQ